MLQLHINYIRLLNFVIMKLIFLLTFFITTQAYSQCKAYRLNRRGDTLNCVDFKDLQQGKWVVKVDGIRGEPGYDEEGIFKDGKKDGFWRIYTSMGDLYAVERYRWGNKDGVSQYFNITGLVREESWKAVNPANPYDTIEVPDPIDPYKVEMKVVKIDGSTVKHGNWKYYENGTGKLVKSESYFLDKKQEPASMLVDISGLDNSPTDSLPVAKKPVAKSKPQAVLEFEKKNSGKKKIKVIDGRTF